MTDKTMNDLIAREDALNKRIERLETLEYETTAFPNASGLTLLCDILLAGPSAAVTLCPVAIPPAFAHLWLIIAAWTDTRGPGKMRMTLNAAVPAPAAGPYGYYVRQEHPFGAPAGAVDTEAVSTFGISSNSSWEICHPAGFEQVIPPESASPESPGTEQLPINSKQCACFVQIPNYALATSLVAGDLGQAHNEWGFAVTEILEADTAAVDSIDEGGGGQRLSSGAAAAVTSVHLAPAVGELFQEGSQFTLYGL